MFYHYIYVIRRIRFIQQKFFVYNLMSIYICIFVIFFIEFKFVFAYKCSIQKISNKKVMKFQNKKVI